MINKKIYIGIVELKNRLVMPPIATYQSTDDGKVTEKMLAYYGARAEGGNIGIIITEHSYISMQGKAKDRQLSISCDDDIEGLRQLVDVIHQNGTKAMAQLNHAGSAALTEITGLPEVSASQVTHPFKEKAGLEALPEELTANGISEIVEAFAKAAARAKLAGFDGVEIHSAHSYLLNQFYSPLTNHRTDEYGGSLENRLRIHKEVIAAVREVVGKDYPIAVRLGGCDYMDGGSTIEDSVQAALILEAQGIDLLDISGGMCSYIREGHDEPGYFKDMTLAIKEKVHIPVILTGGIKTAAAAEALLSEGAADLIGVGRELMKDPHWADREMPR